MPAKPRQGGLLLNVDFCSPMWQRLQCGFACARSIFAGFMLPHYPIQSSGPGLGSETSCGGADTPQSGDELVDRAFVLRAARASRRRRAFLLWTQAETCHPASPPACYRRDDPSLFRATSSPPIDTTFSHRVLTKLPSFMCRGPSPSTSAVA